MLAPVTHINPLAKFRRARMLPEKCNILVKLGQQVNAQDVIAESPAKAKHIIIDVPDVLGVPYSKFERRMITRQVGDRLQKGDVLAETKGDFQRVLRVPADGEIIMVSTGRVVYQLDQPLTPIKAGYPGLVAEVIPEYGVILEINGVLIQGIWGNGRVDSGPLRMINTNGGKLTPAQLDGSLRGAIGVSGQCRERSALLAAAELPLRGLILGSMSADLIETARKLPIPVVLLEGFTGAGINQTAAEILYEHENMETCLNAAQFNRYRGERPEVIIPLQESGPALDDTGRFQPGKMVRVLEDPWQSAIGMIESLYLEPVQLANGLRAKIASVRLENNKKITMPIVNLEIMG
jgi:hypothetical protein